MSPLISAGRRGQRVQVQNPSAPVPDGGGGYTQTWADAAPPTLWVSVETATGRDLERWAHATVTAGRSLVVTGPYHAEITTHTRLLLEGRVLQVAGVDDPHNAHREIVMLVIEQEATP